MSSACHHHDSPIRAHQTLINELIEQHIRFAIALQRSAEEQWVELELTMAQFKAMVVIAQRGPIGINELALVLRITQPTASHLADRLARIELITRLDDPADRRRSLVALSPQGHTLMAKLQRGSHDQLQALLGRMDTDDLNALMQGMRALLAAAESAPIVELPRPHDR